MSSPSIEFLVLQGILQSKEYKSKVISYIPSSMFEDSSLREVFKHISYYENKYNESPSKEALSISLKSRTGLTEDVYQKCIENIDKLYSRDYSQDQHIGWLIDETEKYCKDRAILNAIVESLEIIDGKSKKYNKDAIPELLSKALGTSFDQNIGHDYLENSQERYEFYHHKEKRIRFPLEMINHITKGGIPKKTLSCVIAPTGVGKTFFMTNCAAKMMMDGNNVLYITLEMAEERIAERIDANLLNVSLDDLKLVPEGSYKKKIDDIRESCKGRLIIKEYPPTVLTSSHIKTLLEELKVKKGFVPDVIFVDYINLMASTRTRVGDNSYTHIKSIAEELRSLAVTHGILIFTATQTNRSGAGKSDYDSTETSESFGLPMTLDFMIGLISTPEMEELGHMRCKQLKNRFGSATEPSSFIVGINREKMQFYDVDLPKGKIQPITGTSNNLSSKKEDSSEKFKSFKF